MRPIEVLMSLRDVWLKHPQRALTLTVCPACCDTLLNDLDRMFAPIEGRHSRCLVGSQVMGFTFDEGTPDVCALHPFLHATEVAGG